MQESPNTEAEGVLTYDDIQKFKNRERFWLYATDRNLYIFDQRVSDIYPLADELKDLVLAENAAAFERIKAGLPAEFITENFSFLADILAISDEPVADLRSPTGIATLKLNTSSRCNLSCRYCFREKSAEQNLPDKSLIFKAIDYLVYDCGKDLDSYTIGFNLSSEPLLHLELLEEVFTYTKKIWNKTGKKLEMFFITNGTIFNDKVLKLLKKIRKDRSLSISIDGPREFHDANRIYKSGGGSYDQIVTNLEVLRKKGIRYAAESVLTRDNPQPLTILQHLVGLGFESVNIKPIRNGTPCSFDEASLPALKKGYDAFFAYIEEQLLLDNARILALVAKDFALRPFWRILFNHRMNIRCTWGINTLSMDHKGDFYPCDSVMHLPEHCLGNVAEGIDWEKYHRALNCEIRGTCGQCWARHICAGTCPVNSLQQGKDILAIDPVECALTKYLVEKNLLLLCHLMEAEVDMQELKKIMSYNLYNIYLSK